MPTTYTNGLKLPDLGSIDWYNSYKNNIDILDPIVGTVNGVATTYAPISHNHSASEITSGTIDIARLPPAALERMHIVADQTARYALTTSTVQEGDTVKQTDTKVMYLVVDSTKLNSADGYTEYSAGTASKAIADEDGTSIKTGYVSVAGNQTVTGDKSFTGSNTFNNILPNATNTYSLGSSSYQWSSVYAQSYYYNGTAWGLDKANVWTNVQFFSKNLILTRAVSKGVAPSSDVTAGFKLENEAKDYVFTEVSGKVQANGVTYVHLVANNSFTNGALDPNGTVKSRGLQVGLRSDGTGFIYTDCAWRNSLAPYSSDSNLNLGTSTNKWKTLNGINPGALSLPDYSKKMNVDTTGWSTSAGRINYTPTVNGWLQIAIPNDIDNNNEKSNFITIMDTDIPNDGFNNPSGISAGDSNDYRIQITFPVVANKTYYIYIKSYSGNILAVKYIAALGHI